MRMILNSLSCLPHLAALSPPYIAVLNPPSIALLSPPRIAVFSPPHIAVLSPPRIAVFSPPCIAVLSPPHIAVLSPPHIAAPGLPHPVVLNLPIHIRTRPILKESQTTINLKIPNTSTDAPKQGGWCYASTVLATNLAQYVNSFDYQYKILITVSS